MLAGYSVYRLSDMLSDQATIPGVVAQYPSGIRSRLRCSLGCLAKDPTVAMCREGQLEVPAGRIVILPRKRSNHGLVYLGHATWTHGMYGMKPIAEGFVEWQLWR